MVWVASTPQSTQGMIRCATGKFTHSTNSASAWAQAEQVQHESGRMQIT